MAFRRTGSVVVALSFAMQFALLGSGTLCVSRAGNSSGSADMTAMDMGAGPEAPAAPPESPKPCRGPSVPGECVVLASCAAPSLAATVVAFAPSLPAHEWHSLVVNAPVSRTTAPEPPPPKA